MRCGLSVRRLAFRIRHATHAPAVRLCHAPRPVVRTSWLTHANFPAGDGVMGCHRYQELSDGSITNGKEVRIQVIPMTFDTMYTDAVKVALWQHPGGPGGQAPLTVVAQEKKFVGMTSVTTDLFQVNVVTDVTTGYGEAALPAIPFLFVRRHG